LSRLTPARRRELWATAKALLYLSPSLAIFVAFVFYPVLQSVYLSFFATDPIGRPSVFVGLEQYRRLIETPSYLNALTVSVSFVFLTVPTVLVLALVLALLGSLRLRGIMLFRTIFSSTIAVSGATASLIFLFLYHPAIGVFTYLLDLLGLPRIPFLTSASTALPSVALPSVWLQLGFNTIVILAAMQGIPDELYEAARIDGAGAWHTFRHITVPMVSSTMFFLLVVGTISAFQTFTQVNILTNGGPMESTNVVVYSIYREFYFNGQYGYASAQALMLFGIMLILTILQFGVAERKVYYQ
jgi:multiple sugar transport system permease protein/sn-glycerol 3-phosphate transport system permease protein